MTAFFLTLLRLARGLKEGWEWTDLVRGLLFALGLGPLVVGLITEIRLDVAMAWGLVAIAYWVVIVAEGRQAIESLLGPRGADLEILTGVTPQLQTVSSAPANSNYRGAYRYMRVGVRNPGRRHLDRVQVEVIEVADFGGVAPTHSDFTIPFTLRQTMDYQARQASSPRSLQSMFRGGGDIPKRELDVAFELDALDTRYLDFCEGRDGEPGIMLYSTVHERLNLQPHARYEFTLFVHGIGVRSRTLTLVCEQLEGAWNLYARN